MKIWSLYISINSHNRHCYIWIHTLCPSEQIVLDFSSLVYQNPKKKVIGIEKKKISWASYDIYCFVCSKTDLPQKCNTTVPTDYQALYKPLVTSQEQSRVKQEVHGQAKASCKINNWTAHHKRLFFNTQLSWLFSNNYLIIALQFYSCLANFPSWLQDIRCGSFSQRSISEKQTVVSQFQKKIRKLKFSVLELSWNVREIIYWTHTFCQLLF